MTSADTEQPSTGTRVQAVILAAGLGSRLGRDLPKPLTVLRDGRTILRHQLDALQSAFGEDHSVTLVVGYNAGHLMLAAPQAGFVQNPYYATTNTSKSLWRALRVSGPGGVLWMNGDVVFDPAVLDHIAEAIHADQSFVCVDTASVADEEVKYTVDAHGFIDQLSKTVTGGLGEAIGINYVSAWDKPTLIEHLARCDDNDYFERGIETAIAERGLKIRPLDISAYAAVEVDFEEDLARANLRCVPVPPSDAVPEMSA
ncbi:UDP-N-acetylglucosamine pyrophosphorylase related protein [Kribbella flavida DSM 17836]|uniref:UDP-N-acetylglucosamine pyrophosphorylase related protein n=1 Tax=Kribbella flavida (strain DSM 17836 / JCM 10339 / NBRC 14399) TaxID=479435 RepID=D2Q4U1_KRIFD|nr:phosphocholine cytidylyltransferase family protein [Kribbella flavida]ADB34196.1 UDP-N-acetylglucosamine pyrophosphorylase related protein [Kribbella flavida DSM 17836]